MDIKNTLLIFEKATQILNEKVEDGNKMMHAKQKTAKKLKKEQNIEVKIDPSNDERLLLLQFIPCAVLSSFTVELALKALVEKTTNKQTRGHNIDLLFNRLSNELKLQIKSTVQKKMNIDETKFYSLLSDNKNVFPEWRYVHETKESPIANILFLEKFLHAIKEHLF